MHTVLVNVGLVPVPLFSFAPDPTGLCSALPLSVSIGKYYILSHVEMQGKCGGPSKDFCRTTIHIGQLKKKAMRNMVSWVIVKLPHQTSPKGDHIPHEQEYNTRHGLSAIPNEVRGEIRRQPRQPEVQQEPVVHLFLEAALRRKCGVPGLPVQTAAQPPEPAHGGRAEAHP